MNKERVIQLILEKHECAEQHLNDLAFKYNENRYSRMNFQEGYKYALIEVQKFLETLKEIHLNNVCADRKFFESMKFKRKA